MPLHQSLFVVLTGSVGAGKSTQMTSILEAEHKGQPVASPGLVILAEASAEGSAGAVLLDPSKCIVWPCSDAEEAILAIAKCFPRGGALTLGEAKAAAHAHLKAKAEKDKRKPPPPFPASPSADSFPLCSLVVDGMTSLYNGSKNTCVRLMKEEYKRKHKTEVSPEIAGKKDAPWNDERQTSQHAAAACKNLVGTLNTATMDHRGLTVVVAVNTRPAIGTLTIGEPPNVEVVKQVIGEEPDLGASSPISAGVTATGFSQTFGHLAAKANVIWHCVSDTPDLRTANPADINAIAAAKAKYGVLTMRATYPKYGAVTWVKRQGGEGHLGVFAQLPALWHPDMPCDKALEAVSPNRLLGEVLAWSMAQVAP